MTDYVYGVAHVQRDGELDHYTSHIRRGEAERDRRNCLREGSDCYLVRRPVATEWERAPDEEWPRCLHPWPAHPRTTGGVPDAFPTDCPAEAVRG